MIKIEDHFNQIKINLLINVFYNQLYKISVKCSLIFLSIRI